LLRAVPFHRVLGDGAYAPTNPSPSAVLSVRSNVYSSFCRALSSAGRGVLFCVALTGILFPALSAADASTGAHPAYVFDTFGPELGLPASSVVTVMQTRDGYIWVGTENGLARFDGVRFSTFRGSSEPAFSSDAVRCLFEDRDEQLWIGTDNGVLRYAQGHFERIGLNGVAVRAIAQDGAGRIWLGTTGSGIFSFENGRFRSYDGPPALPSRSVRALFVDSKDRLWLGFTGATGVVYREKDQFQFLSEDHQVKGEVVSIAEGPDDTLWFASLHSGVFRMRGGETTGYSEANGLANTRVSTVAKTSDGALWIASGSYLQKLDKHGDFSVMESVRLPASRAAAFCEDREGSMWLCADDGGFVRMRPAPYRVLLNERPGTGTTNVQSVTEDAKGRIWSAIQNQGVASINADGSMTSYAEKEGLPGNEAWVVFAAKDGSLWSGLRDGVGLWRDGIGRSFPELRSVRTIYEDHEGGIWLGSVANGVYRYFAGRFTTIPLPSGEPILHPTAFYEGPDGAMYIGTWERGLYRFKDGVFTLFNHENGLPSDRLRSVYVDREGHIWIGMKGRGLAVCIDGRWFNPDPFSERFAQQVTALAEDDRGRLWAGTPMDIVWAYKSELLAAAGDEKAASHLHVTGINRGSFITPVWSGGQPVVWKEKDGGLLFATRRGVIAVDPANVPINRIPPPVKIERVSIDNHDVPIHGGIEVPAGARGVAIEYTALSFLQPNRILFKYKLDGYDKDWIDASTRRVAFYSNLPSGRYAFQVKACNNEGIWNDVGDRLELRQRPHFYETWWFSGCLMLALAAGGIALNRWSHRRLRFELERLEQKHAMEKERRRIAKNLHDDLGASLTEIGLFAESVCRKTDSDQIREDLGALFEKVRSMAGSLDAVVWAVNPANDSLDRLVVYVCELFHELFQRSQIRPRVEVSGDIPPYSLSPEERSNVFLVAKEAMNNVLKHSQATEAWLRVSMVHDRLSLTIEDNGRGFDASLTGLAARNGLTNMRSRTDELGGTFALETAPGRGTSITLSLRFENHRLEPSASPASAAPAGGVPAASVANP
jgi:ligand-binding sensor domain-containing protein/signal transduction histidine kinase